MNLDSSKDYIAGFVIILVSLYAARTAPPLPSALIEFIDTMPGRLLFITLIAFTVSFDIRVAIIISVAFTLTLMYVQNEKVKESFMNRYTEHFDNQSESEDEDTSHQNHMEGEEETTLEGGGVAPAAAVAAAAAAAAAAEEEEKEEEAAAAAAALQGGAVQESFTNYQRVTPYISNHNNQCPF
jgi:hypothetical protein